MQLSIPMIAIVFGLMWGLVGWLLAKTVSSYLENGLLAFWLPFLSASICLLIGLLVHLLLYRWSRYGRSLLREIVILTEEGPKEYVSLDLGDGTRFLAPMGVLEEQEKANSTMDNSADLHRGADLRYELTITFEEAVLGCQKIIELSRWERCSHCHGRGSITPTIRCLRCHGQGRTQVNRQIVVNIPAGVDNGINVQVTGEGDASSMPNGTSGDLYVVLTVLPHSFFKRQDQDIIYELSVRPEQAKHGDEVEVPTIDGLSTMLKIPPDTSNNQKICLKGMGVPVVHSSARGNQYVVVKIV